MKRNPFSKLTKLFSKIQVSGLGKERFDCRDAIIKVAETILQYSQKGNKVILVGNGGSASIASHISTDLLKNIKIPALAFSDGSLLTCLSNDLGYHNVFSVPVQRLSRKGDILFAISSSGKSRNILMAAKQARKSGCYIVTFSGFSSSNPLRKMGDINFFVPSTSYGEVEITHLAACHIIIDTLYKK